MKNINIFFCLLGTLVVLLSSCDEDSKDPHFPVDFELQTINSAGIKSTTFGEGETITFRLKLTNTTDEKVSLTNFIPDLICKYDNDFFRIFQQSPVQKDWGRVCMPLNCTKEGQFFIEANQTRVIEYSWSQSSQGCSADMPSLTKGAYRTGFEYVFKASGKYNGQTSIQQLSTTFKVE